MSLRVLLVERWNTPLYGDPFLRRFLELGVEAVAFKEKDFFGRSPASRLQDRLRWGPRLRRLNSALVEAARAGSFGAVFVFRGSHILPGTLRQLRQFGCRLACWQNDNPLGAGYPPYTWRHFLRGLPEYDLLYAYRRANLEQFVARGARRVSLLRSFYLREVHRPVDASGSPYACDVSFVGHWENDGRDAFVSSLLGATDIRFRLWGNLWEKSRLASRLEARFGGVTPLRGDDYNLAVASSKVSLAFLSGLNQDTYTRRCFEIPAARGFMLAQRTEELQGLFEEGKEAEYFASTEELLEKVRFYVRDDGARDRIASAGFRRVQADGHEAIDRAKQVLMDLAGGSIANGQRT